MSDLQTNPSTQEMPSVKVSATAPPPSDTREWILSALQPLVAVLGGLLLSLLVVKILGDSPLLVLQVLGKSAFGSAEDLGMTLFYATPLIFTGLAVAMGFHAGLFNIGAEGQLTWGALAATWVGVKFTQMTPGLAPWVASFAAIAAGALWGWLPGWLRAKRGAHEVITTIMLNFVATGLTSYLVLYHMKSEDQQRAESAVIADSFQILKLSGFGDSPLNVAFILALVVAVLVWLFLWKTSVGYEIRAVGENEVAARSLGIDPGRKRILAMTIAGAIAGMVGINEILGSAGKFRLGFSPDYGFIGIAVALLGRNRPLGVVFSALLFGALHKGTADLDLETEKVTKDFSLILQALIILTVAATAFWEKIFAFFTKDKEGAR